MKFFGVVTLAIWFSLNSAQAQSFTQDDLDQLFTENSKGLIYIWSPSMPLSQLGLADIPEFERDCSIPVTTIQANPSVEEPVSDFMGLDPLVFAGSGALLHYPSYVLYEDSEFRQTLLGYYFIEDLRMKLCQ